MPTVRARIEQEIFYRARKEMVEDTEDLLAEAEIEHQSPKDPIATIEAEESGSEKHDAELTVLGARLAARKQELMAGMERAAA